VVATRLKQEGSDLAESGDFVAALRKWEAAAALNPQDAELHELRAQALLASEQWFPAVQARRCLCLRALLSYYFQRRVRVVRESTGRVRWWPAVQAATISFPLSERLVFSYYIWRVAWRAV
jgi:putative SOS response-associated peptidase YedK